jgi:hypothetical protein
MYKRVAIYGLALVWALLAMSAFAGDSTKHADQEMMPMGPPEEIKELAHYIGTWDAKGKMKWDPASDWQEASAVMTYSWAVDKAAVRMEYSSEFQGMKMVGLGFMCYDRENQEWQSSWIDNMGARISLYTGKQEGDKVVLMGEEKYAGMTAKARITTYDETDDHFMWKYESSMDGGKTWMTSAEMEYTKRK